MDYFLMEVKSFFDKKILNIFIIVISIILLIILLNGVLISNIFEINDYLILILGLFYLFLIYINLINIFSLKYKFLEKFIKLFFSSFIIFILFYVFFSRYFFHFTFEIILGRILIYSLIFILVTFLSEKYFENLLNRFIFNRLERFKDEMEDFKNGNFSTRVSINGVDEIDKLAEFINNFLSKLEMKINYEKKFALIDPLTKCFNRRGLDLNFKKIKSNSLRKNQEFSMIMLDLDDFKKVNDNYGHDIGDKVLIEFSNEIKDILRPNDSVYRLGGEEFLIIFENTDKIRTKIIMNRLKKKVNSNLIENIKEISKNITFSGGFASSNNFDLNDKKVLEKLIKKTDLNLYYIKTHGKNSTKFD